MQTQLLLRGKLDDASTYLQQEKRLAGSRQFLRQSGDLGRRHEHRLGTIDETAASDETCV